MVRRGKRRVKGYWQIRDGQRVWVGGYDRRNPWIARKKKRGRRTFIRRSKTRSSLFRKKK